MLGEAPRRSATSWQTRLACFFVVYPVVAAIVERLRRNGLGDAIQRDRTAMERAKSWERWSDQHRTQKRYR
jgi:hypothetical protein